jgi:hypothetical protein
MVLFHDIPFVPKRKSKKNTIKPNTYTNKLRSVPLFQRIYEPAKRVKKAKLLELLYFVKSIPNSLSYIYMYGTMEQLSKTDRKPFAHMKKPCSMRMEHCGTRGTKPIYQHLLISLHNCIINIIIFFGNYHQKRGNKKTPDFSGVCQNPFGLDFDFGLCLGLDQKSHYLN